MEARKILPAISTMPGLNGPHVEASGPQLKLFYGRLS